jgi:hypothetical protein
VGGNPNADGQTRSPALHVGRRLEFQSGIEFIVRNAMLFLGISSVLLSAALETIHLPQRLHESFAAYNALRFRRFVIVSF